VAEVVSRIPGRPRRHPEKGATMTLLRNPLTLRLALLGVLAAAVLAASVDASAGTQMPPWKWQTATTPPPATEVEQAPVAVSDFAGMPKTQLDNPTPLNTPGEPVLNLTSGNGPSTQPIAAPSPSAVAGGLALLGMALARRRRESAAD
jgi:hypothetical protein